MRFKINFELVRGRRQDYDQAAVLVKQAMIVQCRTAASDVVNRCVRGITVAPRRRR